MVYLNWFCEIIKILTLTSPLFKNVFWINIILSTLRIICYHPTKKYKISVLLKNLPYITQSIEEHEKRKITCDEIGINASSESNLNGTLTLMNPKYTHESISWEPFPNTFTKPGSLAIILMPWLSACYMPTFTTCIRPLGTIIENIQEMTK